MNASHSLNCSWMLHNTQDRMTSGEMQMWQCYLVRTIWYLCCEMVCLWCFNSNKDGTCLHIEHTRPCPHWTVTDKLNLVNHNGFDWVGHGVKQLKFVETSTLRFWKEPIKYPEFCCYTAEGCPILWCSQIKLWRH